MKTCSMCGRELETACFAAKRTALDGRQAVCKECNREYQRQHYLKHKAKYNQKEKDRRADLRSWFQGIKKELKCELCGEDHPATLDFHHRDPSKKEFTVSTMIMKASKARMIAEIAKCSVWCSNCHRKHHAKESRT